MIYHDVFFSVVESGHFDITWDLLYILFPNATLCSYFSLFFFLVDTTVWSTSDYLDAEARIMCVMYERIE